ncbi:polysaccharide pyruvyl transferase family protein [Nocardia rhamnosiphila]
MLILLTGWFSNDSDGNTGGDLLALDAVAEWLGERGVPFVVAVSDPVRYREVIRHRLAATNRVRPDQVDGMVWVCGPLPDGNALAILDRFAGRPTIALGVSVTDSALEHRFDTVIARDRPGAPGRPDLSFGTRPRLVPVVGLIYVGPQPEYRTQHEPRVREIVGRALAERDCAVVDIDTRLPLAGNALRTPAQLESVIARMDVIITTRLHGALLALRNRVPAVALDPVAGGAKLTAQMDAVSWPLTLTSDKLTVADMHQLLDRAEYADFAARLDGVATVTVDDLAAYRQALTDWLSVLGRSR